jgi:hypothetical protein
MKTADRLQAIAQYARRLTRADAALMIKAAEELRNLALCHAPAIAGCRTCHQWSRCA